MRAAQSTDLMARAESVRACPGQWPLLARGRGLWVTAGSHGGQCRTEQRLAHGHIVSVIFSAPQVAGRLPGSRHGAELRCSRRGGGAEGSGSFRGERSRSGYNAT